MTEPSIPSSQSDSYTPEPDCRRCGQPVYVPLSIRSTSRVTTWLWMRLPRPLRLSYNQGVWLAKRLP